LVKSREEWNLFSCISSKNQGLIHFENFWSDKIKAKDRNIQKNRLRKLVPRKIGGLCSLGSDVAQYVKARFSRVSLEFKGIATSKIDSVSQTTIQQITGKCDSIVKNTKINEKTGFKATQH